MLDRTTLSILNEMSVGIKEVKFRLKCLVLDFNFKGHVQLRTIASHVYPVLKT